MALSRRQAARLLIGGAALTLAACQNSTASTPTVPTAANPLVKPKTAGADLVALQASSELAKGHNRFAIGLLDARNQPVTTGQLNLEFFKLKADGTGEKRSESA